MVVPNRWRKSFFGWLSLPKPHLRQIDAIEFDLSSLRLRNEPPRYPLVDNDYQVKYPPEVASRGRMRGVMGRGVGKNKDRDIEDLKNYGAKIYAGEFSACMYAPGAGQYLRDCISIFEEYGWDWSYHSFREALWWNVETVIDPKTGKPVPDKNNDRFRALVDGFNFGK